MVVRVEDMNSTHKAIALVVVLLFLTLPLSGCLDSSEEEENGPEEPVKHGPTIHAEVTNETIHINATIPFETIELYRDITNVTDWSTFSVKVTGKSGTVLGQTPVVGMDKGGYCTTFSAYISGEEDYTLVLKGLNVSFQGAKVELFINQSSVGNETLPEEFAIEGIEVSTTLLDPDERMVEGEVLFDLRAAAASYKPYRRTIPWDGVVARVVDRASGTDLISNTTPQKYDGTLPEEPSILIRVHSDVNMTELWRATLYVLALNRSFEWSYLELYIGDDMVGSVQLEGPFNTSVSNITMLLASPHIREVDINSTSYYKATLNINRMTPKEAKVHWASLTVRVFAEDGSTLVPETALMPDTGVYDTDDSDGIDVGLWYVEVASGDTKASAGDGFILSGLTTAFEGGKVQVLHKGEVVGSVTLPTNFP